MPCRPPTRKTLMITADYNKNTYLSGRNVAKAAVTTAHTLNTYDLLHADSLIISEGSIQKITDLLS